MGDLLENHIRSSCRLALPEGLKELMCDISREVLRVQPQNLYDFIANYLSVLLISREHLSIAHHLCDTVCASSCCKELEDELRFLGLEEEKAAEVKEIIMEHFCSGETSQTKLMSKLVQEVGINEKQTNAVSHALYKAFKRHLVNNTTYYESSTDSEKDEVDVAANHSLQIFRKTDVSNEEYKRAVDNVKASYRAFGVTRHEHHESQTVREDEAESNRPQSKNICFHRNKKKTILRDRQTDIQPLTEIQPLDDNNIFCEQLSTKKLSTVSSSTLAGSYMNLPKFIPYSVHDSNLQPLQETLNENTVDVDYKNDNETRGNQKISFQDPEVEDRADLADLESSSDIEEVISLNSQNSRDSIGIYNHDYNEEIELNTLSDD